MNAEERIENPQASTSLAEAKDQAVRLRDLLLDAAKHAAMTGGEMWKQAESLMGLAKSADALRESIDAVSIGPKDGSKLVTLTSLGTSASRNRESKHAYPKHTIRGDTLVKTGLGRDRRTEYEHIVPKTEFEKILERIAGFVGVKRQFTVEQVQQDLDSPSYQAYILLAILRNKGHIQSERRGQYSFTSPKSFVSDVTTLWNELSIGES